MKLNLVAPLAFAVLCVTAASIEPALAVHCTCSGSSAWCWPPALAILAGGYWLFASFAGAVRERPMGIVGYPETMGIWRCSQRN